MEISERLGPLLESCPWADGIEDLLSIVPELAEEVPPMELVPGSRVNGMSIPLPGASAVLAGVATFLCSTLNDPKVADDLVNAPESVVREDPVVHVLLSMWRHGDRPGGRVGVLPALAAAWSLSGLLGGDGELISHLPTPLASRCIERVRLLRGSHTSAGLGIERRLASRLGARMGAAITLARAGGVQVPAGGVVRRVLTNPLVSLYREDRLEPRRDFVRVCQIFDAPLSPDIVERLFEAAELAWKGINHRLAARATKPIDRLFGTLTAKREVTSVLLDPVLGPGLLRCLDGLVDVRVLRGVGFESRMAKRLLTEQALRPLSAAWADVVRPLQSWRVLSALVGRIAPLWSGAEGDQAVTRPRSISTRWSLRVPSALGPCANHAVVAVRFSDLIDAARSRSQHARAVLRRTWLAHLEHYPDALSTWSADHGISVFPSPSLALRFAESIRDLIPGSEGILHDSVDGPPVVLRPGIRLPVGLDWGRVEGGTDGANVWLDGPAVSAAIHLTGVGPPRNIEHDPLQIRSVSAEQDGLHSMGVVATSRFTAVSTQMGASGVHRFGDGSLVAGASNDFRLYPVPMWWEDKGTVRMWVELGPDRSEGAAELLVVNRLMFRDIFRRDQEGFVGVLDQPKSVSFDLELGDDNTDVIVKKVVQDEGWDLFLSGNRPKRKKRTRTTDTWASVPDDPDVEIEG